MKTMLLSVCLLELSLLLINTMSSVADPQDIFILAGQSNMAGRGGVEGGKWNHYVPPQCKPNPSVYRLSAQLTWSVAQEPLHYDIDVNHTCGVGPGMAFANEVKSKDPSVGLVGLVPCAVGGTKISLWEKGTTLYNQMVSRAKAATQAGGTIRAVLWYQGESDTVLQSDADAYKGNMEALINNFRTDLNNPSLLIIQVALASREGKFVDTVRSAQLGITLPNVKCVDTKGLTLKPDHLHLTTTSEFQLGIKLADTYVSSH